MTTFHLIEKTFAAITIGRLTEIVLTRRAVNIGDRINLCCDATETAVTAVVADIYYSDRHDDLMMVSIKDREATDYDLCDFQD